MFKLINLILMFFFLTSLESNGYSQAIQIGLTSGALYFHSPELFTKSISREGQGYNFDISSKLVIDVHANYSIYNLVGKKEKKNILEEKIEEEKLDSINLLVSIFYKI